MTTEDWSKFNETTKYRFIDNPEVQGYLELPPLGAQGSALPGQAVFWEKETLDSEPNSFYYIWPEETIEVAQ